MKEEQQTIKKALLMSLAMGAEIFVRADLGESRFKNLPLEIEGWEESEKHKESVGLITMETHSKYYKPYYRKLSSLTEEITHEEEKFIPSEFLDSDDYHTGYTEDTKFDYIIDMVHHLDVEFLPHGLIIQLVKWGFWIYDQSYFDKGLILDFNDLKD